MRQITRIQKVTSALAIAALLVSPSVSGENRSLERTRLEQLAGDLELALGRGSVEVQRNGTNAGRPAASSPRISTLEVQAFVDATNRERAAHGLAPLHLNRTLSLAAQDRVADMFDKHYFDHVSPDGVQPFVWAERRGYRYRAIGENLAVGLRDAERVVDGWMNSPGHRKNILGRSFTEIGLAVAPGSPTRPYAGPTVVALYASR